MFPRTPAALLFVLLAATAGCSNVVDAGTGSGLMTLNLSRPGADWTPDTGPVHLAPGTFDALVPGSIHTSDSESSSELTAHTTAEFTTAAKASCE